MLLTLAQSTLIGPQFERELKTAFAGTDIHKQCFVADEVEDDELRRLSW